MERDERRAHPSFARKPSVEDKQQTQPPLKKSMTGTIFSGTA
jgi:hypothetical protein